MSHPVADQQLATQHSLPVATITAFREEKLLEGVHWGREGQRITYTAAGLQCVNGMAEAVLAEKKTEGAAPSSPGPVSPPPGEPTPPPAPEEAPPVLKAKILRLHPNKCWIRCQLDAHTAVDVRVRSSGAIKNRKALLPVQLQPNGQYWCVHPHYCPPRPRGSSSSSPDRTGATSTSPTT